MKYFSFVRKKNLANVSLIIKINFTAMKTELFETSISQKKEVEIFWG